MPRGDFRASSSSQFLAGIRAGLEERLKGGAGVLPAEAVPLTLAAEVQGPAPEPPCPTCTALGVTERPLSESERTALAHRQAVAGREFRW